MSWYWTVSTNTPVITTVSTNLSVGPGLATLRDRLLNGEITKDEARAELDAIPGLVESIAEAEAQLDRKERSSRTYTVNSPTRTFTWPMTQPKPSWWRRLLRWLA